MATKADLEQENAELRRQLDAARAGQVSRPVPGPPSFGICAGVEADIEMHGSTVDPFTSRVLTEDDLYEVDGSDEQ
jgi:hypothetical protein